MTPKPLLDATKAALGGTWSDLGALLGVTDGAIHHWRRGLYPMPLAARHLCTILCKAPHLVWWLRPTDETAPPDPEVAPQ